MVLRSDEMANIEQIERDKTFRGKIGRGLGTAAAIGATAAASPLAARIMPFLSEFVPADLAMKGLSKVSPQLGNMLKKGQEMGLNVEEGLKFIKSKLGNKAEPPKNDRNIIEQESPELFSFLDQAIRAGRNPIEAAAIAQNDKRFKPVIEKLMKTHKTPWSSIIESIFGSGDTAQPGQAPAPQTNPQSGQGSEALMAILSKINQQLGQG